MNKLLEIQDLTVRHVSHTLVDHIHLNLYEEKVNVLIGESGSGKSMTAKAILNAVPKGIDVTMDSMIFKGERVQSIQSHLGRNIGYISQDYTHSFNAHMTIGKQLIAIYRQHFNVSKAEAYQKVLRALKWVDLHHIDMMKRYRFSLSGGQLERVLIASVMMLNPSLIIADEPTASLDVVTGHHIMSLLHHLADAHGVTLFIITHNLSHVQRFSDYINVMREGRMIDQGTKAYFENNHVSAYTKQLFQRRSQLKRGDYHA
ncbi:ATP-binding cassette domain-containing protein [Staphylococcus felis]|uniref:ATP-binding cassette domain-containing protein n=1 Tax=Staphylococcus felis TaxID=46127 RepID=UPI0021D08F37|nr:ATP-binding cassette domain-containing protein [Staphylococcus felis]UXR87032.1 ATP-binding cassette domain-containing protein [Staphylococcus felis]